MSFYGSESFYGSDDPYAGLQPRSYRVSPPAGYGHPTQPPPEEPRPGTVTAAAVVAIVLAAGYGLLSLLGLVFLLLVPDTWAEADEQPTPWYLSGADADTVLAVSVAFTALAVLVCLVALVSASLSLQRRRRARDVTVGLAVFAIASQLFSAVTLATVDSPTVDSPELSPAMERAVATGTQVASVVFALLITAAIAVALGLYLGRGARAWYRSGSDRVS